MNIQHQEFATMEGLDGSGLNGLEGWGSFKKKIGLNKLKTRKVVGKVAKVVPGAALFAPTKANMKHAGKGLATGAIIGAAVIGGPKVLTAAKKIADQVKARKRQKAEMAAAQAEIDRAANAYAAAPAMTGSNYAAPEASAGTDATEEPKKAGWLLPAGLATTALLALV